jgi:hypothetical protein
LSSSKGGFGGFEQSRAGPRTIAGILQQMKAVSTNMGADLITSSHFRQTPFVRANVGGDVETPHVESNVSFMIGPLQDCLPITDIHA